MIARKYFFNGEKAKVAPKGQAAIVFSELRKNREPRLAQEICDSIAILPTRQDKLRVVLYYILVFKKAGFVSAVEQIFDENENVEKNDIFANHIGEQ
jgi:hypothetical protein